MSDIESRGSVLRRFTLAATLVLSLTGITAAVDEAQALPVAAPLAAMSGPAATTVAYSYRRHRRYRYARPRRRAGLYNCGPRALHTRLQSRACG